MSYRNIAFEGGGVLGVAYIGALYELDKRGILANLHGFTGSSVGSIMAAALACNADMGFIERRLKSLDIRSFKDDSYNSMVDGYNIIKHYGFCKGDALWDWCGDILHELTNDANITFEDIRVRYDSILVITGTSLNTLSTVYFSHVSHPEMRVRDAIRISASIPYFFRAIHFDGDVFVDGGVLNNYPLSVFDNNKYNTAKSPAASRRSAVDIPLVAPTHETIDEFVQTSDVSHVRDTYGLANAAVNSCAINPLNKTIGLKIITNNEATNTFPNVTNIKSFTVNIIEAMMMSIAQGHIKKNDWKRTIKINAGDISSTEFSLTNSQTNWLIDQGTNATIEFFKAVSATNGASDAASGAAINDDDAASGAASGDASVDASIHSSSYTSSEAIPIRRKKKIKSNSRFFSSR